MVRNVAWTRWFHASLSVALRAIVPAREEERDLGHAPLPISTESRRRCETRNRDGAASVSPHQPVERYHDEWRAR
jgi:hypothetical protein